MADPFHNLTHASDDFIEQVALALERRASDPTMLPAIDAYLDAIPWDTVSAVLEIGAGTGPISRMAAARAPHAKIHAQEPSDALVARARRLAKDIGNIEFSVAPGDDTGLESNSQDVVIIQTVLSHVSDPVAIIREAHRVLAPGGLLAICDVDFAKAGMASGANDPLDAMAQDFVRQFVTDPHVASKLTRIVSMHGFHVERFRVVNRVLTDNDHMRIWIEWPGRKMVEEGLLGQPLLDALLAEHDRRCQNGTLYGFQGIATLLAKKS